MKILMLLIGLLFVTVPAFAGDPVVEYCFTTADPKACLNTIQADVDQRRREAQREVFNQQLELARIQANGYALFGSGPAMINGVNQGFHQMQQPYVNTPQFQYAPGVP